MMICVMGCYRSGTSAVAGILHHLGVHMGSNFQEPNEGNPKGYFEDPEFIDINRKIYDANKNYKTSRNLLNSDYKKYIKIKASFHALCYDRCSNWNNWGFKDPRFCLTAKNVMRSGSSDYRDFNLHIGSKAKIIWIHRDIDDTVMSIIKALGLNGLEANPKQWRAFVEHYVKETSWFVADHAARNPNLILDIAFPDLMTKPITEITKIAKFVNLPTTHAACEFMGC